MKRIGQMARAGRPADTITDGANADRNGQWPSPAQGPSRPQIAPAWLTVAFGGASRLFALLQCAPCIVSGLDSMHATIGSIAPGASPWVRAAAGYQQLYARQTLEQIPVDESTSAKTVESIRREDGLALRVPDLHEAGLIFKRVQRLRFHDRPLIQIIYLPNKVPLLHCASRVGYALIANNDHVDLSALGKQIADRSVDQLFGALDTTLSATPFG